MALRVGSSSWVGYPAKFFDDAGGSAFECAAGLDASVAKSFVSTWFVLSIKHYEQSQTR